MVRNIKIKCKKFLKINVVLFLFRLIDTKIVVVFFCLFNYAPFEGRPSIQIGKHNINNLKHNDDTGLVA